MKSKRPLSLLSWSAIAGMAAALPLSVYIYFPLLGGFDFRVLLMAVLALAFILDFSPLRLPFELVWPACGAALFGTFGATPESRFEPMVFLAAYLTAGHLTARGPRWKPNGCPWPGGFSPASLCLAAMAAASAISSCMPFLCGSTLPTAYSPTTGAVLYGPYAMSDGVLMLSFCLLAALWPCWKFWKGLPVHPAGILCAIPIFTTLLLVAYATIAHMEEWRPRGWGDLPTAEVLALLLITWLLCRLAAKLAVRGFERREPELHLYAAGVGMALLFAMLTPLEGKLELAFLAGIAAGAACPQRAGAPRPVFTRSQAAAAIAAIILLGVFFAVLNVRQVYPRNRLDPRNYPAMAARDIREKHFERLEQRMDFMEKRLPGERGTHIWRARAALAQAQINAAVHEGLLASRPSASPPLVPITRIQWTALLQELRDRISRAPEQVSLLDYTQLLAVQNGPDAAYGFLQLRQTAEPGMKTAMDSRPLAKALDFLLGGIGLEPRLAAQPAGELVSLLRQCGAVFSPSPEAFPDEALPLVLAASNPYGETLQLVAATPQHAEQCAVEVQNSTDAREAHPYWREAREGAVWAFHLAYADNAPPIASISWNAGQWSAFQPGPETPSIAENRPAIRIWLPREASLFLH